MTDYWADNLRLASIHGVEVDVSSRRISGGHAFGRHMYQGRAGQDTEPTGAQPLALALTIELDRAVDESNYPSRYMALLDVLQDTELGGRIDYIDPIFGPLPMQVVNWTATEQAGRRNGAVIELSIEQRVTDTLVLSAPLSAPRGGAGATAMARQVDLRMPSRGVYDDHIAIAFATSGYPLTGDEIDLPVGAVFAGIAQTTIARFETSLATVDIVRGEVAKFRARCAAMEATPQLQHPEAVEDRLRLIALADFVSQAGYEAIAKLGIEATYQPSGSVQTAHAIAGRVYGDPMRWLDVVASNGAIRNPLRITTTSGPLRVFVPRGRSAA